MIYENASDRFQQTPVVNVVKDFLTAYPVVGTDLNGKSWWKLVETPERLHEHHDFDIYHQGRLIGVGEVKCRGGKYTRDFFKGNGWLLTESQLKELYRHHRHGKQVLLVLRTADDHVLLTTFTKLIELKDQIKPAPDGFCKNNHGTQPSNRTGVIIPFESLTYIGSTK